MACSIYASFGIKFSKQATFSFLNFGDLKWLIKPISDSFNWNDLF